MKKVLIVILAIVAVVLIASVFLPSEVSVERSATINASAGKIFNEVNSLQKWAPWSPWAKIDPDGTEWEYSGPEVGVGNKVAWKSDHEKVGAGTQEIVSSEYPTAINTHMEFEGQGGGEGNWKFEEVDGATKVTWSMSTNVGSNPIGKFFGLMMDGMVGPQFEQGLADLKSHVEGLPDPEPVTEVLEELPVDSLEAEVEAEIEG